MHIILNKIWYHIELKLRLEGVSVLGRSFKLAGTIKLFMVVIITV
jgi:hypothetical protein